MKRRNASAPFVDDNGYMLALGLLTRETGVPASQRLEIGDPVNALGFDLAVSWRMLRFDNEKDRANKKFLARSTAKNSPLTT